jgi:hypothetical protein
MSHQPKFSVSGLLLATKWVGNQVSAIKGEKDKGEEDRNDFSVSPSCYLHNRNVECQWSFFVNVCEQYISHIYMNL